MTKNEIMAFRVVKNIRKFASAAAGSREKREKPSIWDDIREQGEAVIGLYLEVQQYRAIGTVKDCGIYKRIAEKELANACLSLGIIDELEEYKAIGTVGECREAMERQKERKPELWGDGCDKDGNIIYDMYDCPNCGQRILWECDGKGASGKESGNERKSIQGKAHPCIQ